MTSSVSFVPFAFAFQPFQLPAWAASAAIAITAAIASAITAAGTTAAGASSASAIAATIGARTSFVHGDGPPTKIGPIQGLDRCTGLRVVGHLDEAESPQAPAKLIANEVDLTHSSVFSKCLSQIIFTGAEREISNVDIQERCPSFRK